MSAQKIRTARGPAIRDQAKEPLTEGLAKVKHPRNFLKSMSDQELMAFACKMIEDEGIKSPMGLERAYKALYRALKARGLMDSLRFEKRRKTRRWGSDEEVLTIAKSLIAEKGIVNKAALEKEDSGLFAVLRVRGLLGRIEFEKRCDIRRWRSDEEILGCARKLIEERHIRNRNGLDVADQGLYCTLRRRGLLDSIAFAERAEHRRWATDNELLEYARKMIEERGIKSEGGLKKADRGVHAVLRKRNLLDSLDFEERRKNRKWGTDEEVLDYAQRLIREKGITNRNGLSIADQSLYALLMKRKLIDSLGLEEKEEHRSWGSDGEVLRFARALIEERGIRTRSGLCDADAGLYSVLRARELLSSIDFEERHEQRKWGTDEEVLEFAAAFIEKAGITKRSGINDSDPGLYLILRKRGLLDRLFLPIERSRESEERKKGLEQIAEALDEFGDTK